MLGEFSSVKLQGETEAAAAADAASAGPNAKSAEATPKGPQAASASGEEELSEDMFAKQLQAGMADLLGELENSVCFDTSTHLRLNVVTPRKLTGAPAARDAEPI